MERQYTNVFGETIERDGWNKHHVFARCKAKGMGGLFQRFINQRGLVLPMLIEVHADLHANVDFPIIPTLSLIHRLNEFMQGLDTQNRYDRYLAFTDHVAHIAETTGNTGHREQCERIAENLAQQSIYILQGQVLITPLQEAA